MTPGNYGSSDPPPANQIAAWPPPPTTQPGVWPPAPTAPAAVMAPFKSVPQRAAGKEWRKARYSDFREGRIQADAAGLSIAGKAVLRAEIRYPIFIVLLLIIRFLGLIAYLVMEYAFRQDAAHQVPWDAVRRVQLAPQKQQACVIYDAPNYKGVVKTYSLAFSLDAGSYPAFARHAQQFAPDRLTEGKLRNAVSAGVWIRLAALAAVLILAAIAAVTRHH